MMPLTSWPTGCKDNVMSQDHSPDIKSRKADHLELCASGEVEFREASTLLECVRLVHQALPELAADDIDLSATIAGRKLAAPVVVWLRKMISATRPAMRTDSWASR